MLVLRREKRGKGAGVNLTEMEIDAHDNFSKGARMTFSFHFQSSHCCCHLQGYLTRSSQSMVNVIQNGCFQVPRKLPSFVNR